MALTPVYPEQALASYAICRIVSHWEWERKINLLSAPTLGHGALQPVVCLIHFTLRFPSSRFFLWKPGKHCDANSACLFISLHTYLGLPLLECKLQSREGIHMAVCPAPGIGGCSE